jgi:hypothetical protein
MFYLSPAPVASGVFFFQDSVILNLAACPDLQKKASHRILSTPLCLFTGMEVN